MSRPLRIEIENGIYHVTSRGWERRVIVTDDRDRQQWFFHLFLKAPNADLSAGMHDLNSEVRIRNLV